jgi:hypothetical protein
MVRGVGQQEPPQRVRIVLPRDSGTGSDPKAVTVLSRVVQSDLAVEARFPTPVAFEAPAWHRLRSAGQTWITLKAE